MPPSSPLPITVMQRREGDRMVRQQMLADGLEVVQNLWHTRGLSAEHFLR
jgi:hypothetical protein